MSKEMGKETQRLRDHVRSHHRFLTMALLSTFAIASTTAAQTFSFQQLPRQISGAGNPKSIALLDINNDGKLDVVIGESGTSKAFVYLYGNGDGTFSGKVRVTDTPTITAVTDLGAAAIAVGDFDGDHVTDFAITNYFTQTVRIFFSRGGALVPGGEYPLYATPQSMKVADVNNDGVLDLIVGTESNGNAVLLMGVRGGTFQSPPRTINFGSGQPAIEVGDVNNDGKLDLIAAQDTINSVSIVTGHGDGTFDPPVFKQVAPGAYHSVAVALGHFGPTPLGLFAATKNGSQPGIDYLYFPRLDSSSADGVAAFGSNWIRLAHADLNRDGIEDIVIANAGPVTQGTDQGGMVEIVTYDSNPARQAPRGMLQFFLSGATPSDVAIGDLNNDGRKDIAVIDYYGALYVFLNTTTLPPARRRAARH